MNGFIPLSFSSVGEAKSLFEYGLYLLTTNIADPTLGRMAGPMSSITYNLSYFETLISSFLRAIQQFSSSKGQFLTQRDAVAMAALKLHVLNSYISFHLDHLPLEYRSNWHELMPYFKEMVALSEKIIASEADSVFPTTSFCLDMGLIIPLYTVASQCHDPALRRNAITILRSTSRQEGLWNSLLIAQVAERIIEIEESRDGNMSTLQETAPVLDLDNRGGRLRYLQYDPGVQAPFEIVEEIFSW